MAQQTINKGATRHKSIVELDNGIKSGKNHIPGTTSPKCYQPENTQPTGKKATTGHKPIPDDIMRQSRNLPSHKTIRKLGTASHK